MANIREEDLMNHGWEGGMLCYSAEASELGWRPGEWPLSIKVEGLGNGQSFARKGRIDTPGGDLGGFTYDQCFGCVRVTVFND